MPKPLNTCVFPLQQSSETLAPGAAIDHEPYAGLVCYSMDEQGDALLLIPADGGPSYTHLGVNPRARTRARGSAAFATMPTYIA